MGPEILRPLFEGHILALIWVHHLRGIWDDDNRKIFAAPKNMTIESTITLIGTKMFYTKCKFKLHFQNQS